MSASLVTAYFEQLSYVIAFPDVNKNKGVAETAPASFSILTTHNLKGED